MQEIVNINLENEMDLIVAHKRSMKAAELSGLSLSAQTIFATAVSEVGRCVIEIGGLGGYLSLGIEIQPGNRRALTAVIAGPTDFCTETSEAIVNARRLVHEVRLGRTANEYQVVLSLTVNYSNLLSDTRVQAMANFFEKDTDLSPYEELRRKNLQLQELATRLRESQENYRVLTDTLPLMMFAFDDTGKVLYTNQWFKNFLGFTVDHLPTALERLVHPDDYSRLLARWNTATASHSTLQDQIRLREMNTLLYVWHLISVMPMRNDEGTTGQWIGFFVDIHAQKLVEQTLQDNTELKAAHTRLEEYQHELEAKIAELNASNHALEQFAYIASHDLQEPLRKIQTFADLLGRSLGDRDAAERFLTKITASASRMGELIRGVLAYSRLSQTQEPMQPVDLNAVLATVRTDFELLIAEKNAVITATPLPVVPGLPLQLTQLFTNLIGNALKFTEREPVIDLSARPLDAEEAATLPGLATHRTYVEITIRDNGIGFDPVYAEQIFLIFQRLNDRRSFGGTGIGLALCKKIVDNHRGHISAISAPDAGATFVIVLPRQ